MILERRRLMSTKDVALTLGYVRDDGQPALNSFYRARAELRARKFPEPVIGRKKGQRWDPAAVEDWLDAQRPATAPDRDDLEGWERELANRLES